jgi:hypothetical protein
MRESNGASAASIGEMRVDLGLTQVLGGRGRQGAALIGEGIEDCDPTSARTAVLSCGQPA